MLDIPTVEELATLLGTTQAILGQTLKSAGRLTRKLIITDLSRPGKKAREVYDPCGQLRALQKKLYANILLPRLDRSPHSFGGVKGRNHLRAARRHRKSKFVFSGDVRNFYPNIHFKRVERLFLDLGCSSEVAYILTRLTTHNYRLEQGFITSPILADRIFRAADKRIARLCDKQRLVYTRFVDDIAISGSFNLMKSGVPATIATILEHTGFMLHPGKTDGGSIKGRTLVLGLRLNKGRPDVCVEYYNETVRRLMDMASLGQNGEFTGPFFTRAELYGRVRYVCWVNPRRRPALFRLWRGLDWEAIRKIAADRSLAVRQRRIVIDRGETELSPEC